MDTLKAPQTHSLLFSLLCCLLLSSCARISYVMEQTLGQFSLISRARWNEKVLQDPEVKEEHKDKIRQVIKYKKYFFQYWGEEPSKIYSKTTFLDSEAVTWLVVISPYDRVEAHEECFPFMGCFPYLGFFEKDSAREYAGSFKERDWHTYMRPVYAYSTLTYFTDPILSSFFQYNRFDLAELVFHELFHTIFFAVDEVELNENLANFFGRQMAYDYFDYNQEKIAKLRKKRQNEAKINQKVSDLAGKLDQRYRRLGEFPPERGDEILHSFLEKTFRPEIHQLCERLGVAGEDCYPLEGEWNNASLASYLTYEAQLKKVEKLKQQLGLGLRGFFEYIKQRYKSYQKENLEGQGLSFSEYLFSPLESSRKS